MYMMPGHHVTFPSRRLTPGSLLRLAAAALLLAATVPGELRAQGSGAPRSLEAHRLSEDAELQLDGRVQEPAWERADAATDFRQREPDTGAPATERTVVRVAYDDENLYIAAVLHDDPDGVLAYKRKRDAGLGAEDRFMWILDTFMDERTGYFFEINPAGLMGDGLIGTDINKSWDGIWEAHVERGPWGWSAEIRIPFSTLNFDPSLTRWGINFQRTVRRKNEEALWEGHRPNQSLFNPTYAGRLTNLTGISQGLGLQFRPYGLAGWQREPAAPGDPSDASVDGGFDLSYSLTPRLRAAATVNTDFAEVEVDRRRVNLTRFPLFFPEKRDFFLENSGVYEFAPANDQQPFFSRRIGLVEGQEVPIDAGVRLGGQAGDYELGFLQVRTGDSGIKPAEDFTVARVKRRILEESTIGAVYTRRATEPGEDGVSPPDRHTVGTDLLFFTSSFMGDRNLRAQAFGVWHSRLTRGSETDFGDRSTRGARLSYPNDIWRASVSYREFGDDYDPPVGFVQRTGFRRLQPSASWNPRPDFLPWLRQANLGVRLEDLWSLEGTLLTRDRSFTLPGLNLESGDEMSFEFGWNTERLRDEFEISDGVVLPVGRYDNFDWTLSAETAGRRVVSGEVSVTHGGFWSGDRTRWRGGVTVRPATGVSAEGQVVRNEVDLPQGEFTTNVYRLIGEWHPSPWLSVTQNWQYDDVSDVLGLQGRLRWIVEPGNELYVVYTHNWRSRAGSLDPFAPDLTTLSRSATTKLVYSMTL